MKNGTVKNLGELELRELVDLGLRMPDGSKEFFEVVDKRNDCITVMTKNIIDFIHFNASENKLSGKENSYTESSIRKYLAELYQSLAKENAELDKHNYGFKEFFLPSVNMMGFGAGKGWQAFKDDASRVKYSGTYAVTKDEAYGSGESDWYWTSTPNASCVSLVRSVNSAGALRDSIAYYGGIGVAPALNLKAFAPVTIIDGVWSLCNGSPDTSNDESVDIKIGDWVEVTETTKLDEAKGFRVGSSYKVIGKDTREGILIVKTIIGYLSILASKVKKIGDSNEKIEAGDWVEVVETLEEDSSVDIDKGYVTQVMGVLSDDGVEIRTKDGDTWWLHPFQVKKVGAPKSASAENPNENSEILKPITEKVSDNSPNNNSDNIEVGDWVEVVQTEEVDIIRGLKLGSKLKVLKLETGQDGTLYKLQWNGIDSIHFLWDNQIKKTESLETKEQAYLKYEENTKKIFLKSISEYVTATYQTNGGEEMNAQKTVEFLVERTLENNQVSTSYFETKEQVSVEIGCYPKGVSPARKVLDELFDWAEDRGLDEVVEKIIELEEKK